MKDNIIIYTDGGCRGNPGLGAWASILISEKYNLRLRNRRKRRDDDK